VPRLISSSCGGGNQDSGLAFRIIFFAIPSATICSDRGMNGLLLHARRHEEGLPSQQKAACSVQTPLFRISDHGSSLTYRRES
jgi:hypothetical protein